MELFQRVKLESTRLTMRSQEQISSGLLRRRQQGSMMIELLFATTILAVGFGGLMVLLVGAVTSDTKSRGDTTSTMLAEHVMEQISSEPANSNTGLTITDCAGTAWSIATTGAALGGGNGGSLGGNGANLTSTGIIDWTQSYSTIPTDGNGNDYAMKYVACGAGGRQTTYDVRWDVITMDTYARMVIISARPLGSAYVGGLQYVVPINLRTIAGM